MSWTQPQFYMKIKNIREAVIIASSGVEKGLEALILEKEEKAGRVHDIVGAP